MGTPENSAIQKLSIIIIIIIICVNRSRYCICVNRRGYGTCVNRRRRGICVNRRRYGICVNRRRCGACVNKRRVCGLGFTGYISVEPTAVGGEGGGWVYLHVHTAVDGYGDRSAGPDKEAVPWI